MSEAVSDRRGWLFGSGVDLVLGCGVLSMGLMLAQASLGQKTLSAWVPGSLIILLFALPHYGATLIRVYEDPVDRGKYRLFSVWATVLLACGFVASLSSHFFGSLLLTLYLTWSPWHYTGQNYGIALMLAARRGVTVSPLAKRFVYASFGSSFLLTVFAIHSGQPEGSYAPVSYGGTVYELLPVGIPYEWVGPSILVLGGVYLVSTVVTVVWLVRSGSLRAAAPALILMATQALWFSLPVPLRHWDFVGAESVLRHVYTPYGFLWIAGCHSLQYLWITTYFATGAGSTTGVRSSIWARRGLFLGKSALMGYAIWILPALLFAPGLLGRLPFESGLAVMVGAMVNLHHFILDGAIWKLRDGRVARVLLRASDTRGQTSTPEAPIEPSHGVPWVRRGFQAAGAICLAYGLFMFWVDDFGFSRAMSRGDLVRAERALDRLAMLGRDGPGRRTELGRRMAREGHLEAARGQFARSLSLEQTSRGYQSLGLLHEQRREWRAAATAYDSALALAPDDVSLLSRAGRAWLEEGNADRAVPLLERAAGLAPNDSRIERVLARARREADATGKP